MKIRRATVMLALLSALLSVSVVLLAETAIAKAGVGQITVSGPGLEHQIEVDDPQILDQFNPWGGLHRFLGERLEESMVETPALEGPYQVRFSQSVHEWVYELSYYIDEDAAVGYILLPQPPVSQGFVHPAGWYRSSDAWDEAISEQLQGEQNLTRSGDRSVGDLFIAVLAIALITGIGVAIRRQDRARSRAASDRLGSRTQV